MTGNVQIMGVDAGVTRDAESEKIFVVPKRRIGYEICKRVFDVVMSLLAMIVLSPVFLLTAVAIKLEDGGSVFYNQTRVTAGGREFTMYKFRSMRVTAEEELPRLLGRNEMTGPVFKIKGDPRITKVGRFIRRASIDELPQLLNVLKGEMSIVGPRPPLPQEVARYTPYQMHRLDVKTGLSCYRECHGRSLIIDFDEWVEMDLKYIRERGVMADLKIILRTILVVITGEGAE